MNNAQGAEVIQTADAKVIQTADAKVIQTAVVAKELKFEEAFRFKSEVQMPEEYRWSAFGKANVAAGTATAIWLTLSLVSLLFPPAAAAVLALIAWCFGVAAVICGVFGIGCLSFNSCNDFDTDEPEVIPDATWSWIS